MAKTSKPDWNALKIEYVNSSISYVELAKKHNVSRWALEKRGQIGKWLSERQRISAKVSETAQAKIILTRTQELEALNAGDLVMAKALRASAGQMIQHLSTRPVNKRNINEYLTAARVAEVAQKMGRLALNATTENSGVSTPDGQPVESRSDYSIDEYKQAMRDVMKEI